MTLGMILTVIVIVCTVVGGAAGLVKSIFVDAPRDLELERQYRKVKPKATPKPRKRSYEVIYKDTRRRK